jgi:hypothetical protein
MVEFNYQKGKLRRDRESKTLDLPPPMRLCLNSDAALSPTAATWQAFENHLMLGQTREDNDPRGVKTFRRTKDST